ncbi:hypothetical protein DFJ73DRAFT_849028 [Zopfochytrium polystomum]|nr:hypothetical protein DFJ73DRAFT_849028 [Zopfochytrium polystomum]
MLTHGANPSVRGGYVIWNDFKHDAPLWLVAARDDLAMLRVLLVEFETMMPTNEDETPHLWAPSVAAQRLLLRVDGDENAVMNVLRSGVRHFNPDMVRLALALGARPNTQDAAYMIALCTMGPFDREKEMRLVACAGLLLDSGLDAREMLEALQEVENTCNLNLIERLRTIRQFLGASSKNGAPTVS